MKAQDLRIGNLVYAHKIGLKPLEGELIEKVIEKGEDIDNAFWWTPIPLTEEWLIKFGFEKDDNVRGYVHKSFRHVSITFFHLTVIHLCIGDVVETPIYYVHEVQNLYFALTGEELLPPTL